MNNFQNFDSPQTQTYSDPQSEVQPDVDRVQVFVRVRPQFQTERKEPVSVRCLDDYSLEIESAIGPKDQAKEFGFSRIFDPKSTQAEVFKFSAQPLIDYVLQGYNGTYFVYGQTGTGKSHTMGVLNSLNTQSQGVVPATLQYIFQYLYQEQRNGNKASVHISFYQIYLEQISDLLNPEQLNLKIKEEQGEVYVHDLVEVPVENLEQALNLVNAGLQHRVIASQSMNDTSSRSHTVLHIDIEQHKKRFGGQTQIVQGRLVLADLAGSERVRRTTSSGIRLEEAKHINVSLSALGNVINGLASQQEKHIPYRSSKLTRVLTNNLSLQSKIVVLCTVGPSASNYQETLTSLQFARRCQDITLKPKRCQIDQGLPLEVQNQMLQQELQQVKDQTSALVQNLQQQLEQKEEQLKENEHQIYQQQIDLAQVKQELSDLQHLHAKSEQENLTLKSSQNLNQPQPSTKRALMVADMTTYMAKLVSKLTESAVTFCNSVIQKTSEINTKSRENLFQKSDLVQIDSKDLIEFKSNVEILEDETLDIPTIVQKVQRLAKKHVECLNLLHTFSQNQLENSHKLYETKTDLLSKINQLQEIRSSEASSLISFAINHLEASETQVKTMFGRVNCSFDRDKLIQQVRNVKYGSSRLGDQQRLLPNDSSLSNIRVENAKNVNGLKSFKDDSYPQSPTSNELAFNSEQEEQFPAHVFNQNLVQSESDFSDKNHQTSDFNQPTKKQKTVGQHEYNAISCTEDEEEFGIQSTIKDNESHRDRNFTFKQNENQQKFQVPVPNFLSTETKKQPAEKITKKDIGKSFPSPTVDKRADNLIIISKQMARRTFLRLNDFLLS